MKGLSLNIKEKHTPGFLPRIIFFLNSSQSLANHSKTFKSISITQGAHYNADFQALSVKIQTGWGWCQESALLQQMVLD